MRPARPSLVTLCATVLAATLAFAGVAAAQGADGWSQFQGGPEHVGTRGEGPEPGYRTAWAVGEESGGPRDAYGLSAPVIAEDVAVATGPVRVVAFDLATGELAWEVDRVLGPSTAPAIGEGADGPLVLFTEGWGDGPPDASETPAASTTPGASASPSGTTGGSGPAVPRLVAVPAGEGEPAWSLDLTDVSRTGVTVAGDLAIVGSIDGTVTAADVTSGEVAWTAEVGGFLEVPAAASRDLVLVSVRGDQDAASSVVALSLADGTEAWRYEPQTGAFSVGPPSIGGETAYVALADGTVRAVALADGVERWRAILNAYVNPFSPASAPTLVGDAVLVADVRGQLYRLDAATGERVWDHAYNHPVLRSSPVAVGDHVILATTDGRLAAFDLSGGDLVWDGSVATADGVPSSSPLRAMAVSGDALVVVRGGTDAGMAALVHDPAAGMTRQLSPTIIDLPALLVAWAASLAVAMALFVIGRLLWARIGPVEIPGPDEIATEEDA